MIAYLHGKVREISGEVLTLDVNGVGYEVICTANAADSLALGSETGLIVYTDVKEDSIRLFGFVDRLEREVFLLLLRVTGVGSRTALDIVSQADRRELLRMIGEGDVSRLQKIKGIGKKTAERIVVELRDKVSEVALERKVGRALVVEREVVEPFGDAVQALEALGFSRKDAERAVERVNKDKLPPGFDSGVIVREALRYV